MKDYTIRRSKRLRYTRRGWFFVIEFLTGTAVWGTDVVLPDQYGCYSRRLLVGPFDSAAAALKDAL